MHVLLKIIFIDNSFDDPQNFHPLQQFSATSIFNPTIFLLIFTKNLQLNSYLSVQSIMKVENLPFLLSNFLNMIWRTKPTDVNLSKSSIFPLLLLLDLLTELTSFQFTKSPRWPKPKTSPFLLFRFISLSFFFYLSLLFFYFLSLVICFTHQNFGSQNYGSFFRFKLKRQTSYNNTYYYINLNANIPYTTDSWKLLYN